MQNKVAVHLIQKLILIICVCNVASCKTEAKRVSGKKDLVLTNTWYIAGPSVENNDAINDYRKEKHIVQVTTNNSAVGEIELNVMITPSGSNDGPPTTLSEQSNSFSLTYKSSHDIVLQAREGNESGTGCVHGGIHATVLLPATNQFSTKLILWKDFKQDGLPKGKTLNTHNLCKFNFVNYHPVSGAKLEIVSLVL
jgi:hypothetical protein